MGTRTLVDVCRALRARRPRTPALAPTARAGSWRPRAPVTRLRGIRARLLLAVLAAIGLALVGTIAGFNLFLASSLSRNATDEARARAAAQRELLRPVRGRLTVTGEPEARSADGPVWIFASGRLLERPRASPALDAAARALASSRRRVAEADEFRLVRLRVGPAGRELGSVVAAVSLEPYERTRHLAFVGSLVLGALLFGAVALGAHWLVAAALRPVRLMTREAAAWSEHDPEHRFDPGEPRDELAELAATLDTLLDRLAASLRHEQRFSAELSHELRTPLARIAAEAELALRRERRPEEYRAALELVLRSVDQMTRTVDALVRAAQHEAGLAQGTSDAYAAAAGAVEACAALAAAHGVAVRVEGPPAPARLGVDRDAALRILQPLVENACRYGGREVDVTIRRAGSRILYTVADDGPGIRAEEVETIFEPGVRGAAAEGASAGAGLGLALARRLARAAAGEVTAEPGGGGRFTVALPAA